MLCMVVVMCHVRAVRFVHAFCSDMVVLVSALLSLVVFLPPSAVFYVVVFAVRFDSCFCLCVFDPPCRFGDQIAGGHLRVAVFHAVDA